MPVNGNIPVQRSVLPEGIAGVDATVRKMVELAHSQYGSKSAKIRAAAIDIVRNAGVPDKDYYGEIIAIHNWIRDNIRYVRDPIGQETLSYPEETLFNSRAGDCDDMTVLEIAMLGAIGMEAFPVVVGMFPGHFSHVYLYAKVPPGKHRNAGKILPLDPIMKNWEAGREAKNVKAKKTYPHLSNPMTMNGLSMGQDIGDLGAYAIAPSYLDTEDSHAGLLVVPDKKASYIHDDKTVANASRVNMPFSGVDSMFGGPVVRPTGDNFTETSAGDGGTIVESGGQLVPKGFIRKEPDLKQTMAMQPATAAELGPRGPIFNRRARDNVDYLKDSEAQVIPSTAAELRGGGRTERIPTVPQPVGVKRYDLPNVEQALRRQKGLVANPVRRLDTQPIVAVSGNMTRDRLGMAPKKLPTLGEQLAGLEMELAGTMRQANQAAVQASKPQAMAHRHAWVQECKRAKEKIKLLEKTILDLRQQLRDRGVVTTSMPAPAPVSGMGEGIMDTLKKPIVWGPLLAFAGVVALRLILKKRQTSPAA